MKVVFLLSVLVTGFSSCLSKNQSDNDSPAPIYPSPKTIPAGIEKKYTINPTTGDSIKPLKNSKGQLVKTGVAIPAIDSNTDSEFFLAPKTIPATWSFADSLPANKYPIVGKPDIVFIDEKKLAHIVIEKNVAPQIHLDTKDDSVISGVPIPVTGEVVICKIPLRKRALPMSIIPNSMYNLKNLGLYHDMNSSDIRHIMEDSRGNLWLSSFDGLTCFDGKSFFLFTAKEGLIDNAVQYTHEDKKGNIWISYGAKGISCYDGKKFTHFRSTQKSSFSVGGNCAIAEDKNGILWFKNFIKGLTRFDGKNFIHYTTKEGLSSNLIRDIMVDSKNRIWLSTHGGGVSVLDGATFTHIKKKDGLNHDIVSATLEDKKGNIWFGTDSGFARYNGKTLERFTKNNGLSGNLVGSINEDRDGNIWFGTYDNGVTKFDGHSIMSITEKEGLPNSTIINMTIDKNGGHWFASNSGVSYFKENFTRLDISPNYNGKAISRPIIDNSGNFLLKSSEREVLKKIGNVLYRFTGTDVIKGNFMLPLFYDREGNFWFSVQDSKFSKSPGLGCFDGKNVKLYISKSGHMNDFVTTMLQDKKGNYWIGCKSGLIKLSGNCFTYFTETEGLSNNNIRSLLEDFHGNIWIGSHGGLTKYDGASFTHYTESEGLPRNFISSMVATDTLLWLSTFKEIVLFDGKKFISLTEREGLPANNVISLIGTDSSKNIWITSRKGVSRIPYNYCDSSVNKGTNDNKKAKEGIITFTERDGILPPLLAHINSANDKMFLESTNTSEQYIFDIKKQNKVDQLILVNIKDVTINGRRTNFHEPEEKKAARFAYSDAVLFYNVPIDLKLPHNYNYLTFVYASKGEYANQNILYSYKMEGLEKKWSSPSEEEEIRYPFLPPGKYTFKVKAMNRMQQWGPATEFTFIIRLPFWKRWWFLTLLTLLIAGIVYRIIQRRIAYIKIREEEKTATQQKLTNLEYKSRQAVLSERLRISSDLHDEVGATLSGIAMYSHLTKEQIKSNNITGINNSLEVIQQNSTQMVDKLNDIVWFINPEKDSITQLVSRLEDYIYKMTAIKNIKAVINKTSITEDITLSTEIRRNIYLFCKEAINNSVKHSKATLLELTVEEKKGYLDFKITDNGKAFDSTASSHGNGLKNMQKRAVDIGAEFLIKSAPLMGCTISLKLKITQRGIV